MKNIREIDTNLASKINAPHPRLGAVPTSGTSTKETTARLHSNVSAHNKYNINSSQPHIQEKSRIDHYLQDQTPTHLAARGP